MVESRIAPESSGKQFDNDNWLVHLVNTEKLATALLVGGHAALIVEGQEDDHVVLRFYDIRAAVFSATRRGWFASGSTSTLGSSATAAAGAGSSETSHGNNGRLSYIVNVRIIKLTAPLSQPDEVDRIYSHPLLKRSGSLSRKITKEKATELHRNVVNDQRRTVKAIAGSFLNAQAAQANHEAVTAYFTDQAILMGYFKPQEGHRDGVVRLTYPFSQASGPLNGIERFLELCRAIQLADLSEAACTNFLKVVHTTDKTYPPSLGGGTSKGLHAFLMRNLNKMRQDGLLFNPAGEHKGLIPFSLTGPGFFVDTRSIAKREAVDAPLNCMRWCTDHLTRIGVTVRLPDNPKKIVCAVQ